MVKADKSRTFKNRNMFLEDERHLSMTPDLADCRMAELQVKRYCTAPHAKEITCRPHLEILEHLQFLLPN
jgi:hypothetical protein